MPGIFKEQEEGFHGFEGERDLFGVARQHAIPRVDPEGTKGIHSAGLFDGLHGVSPDESRGFQPDLSRISGLFQDFLFDCA